MAGYVRQLLLALVSIPLVFLACAGTQAALAGEVETSGASIKGDPFADSDLFATDLTMEALPEQGEQDLATLELHGYLESRNQYGFNESEFLSARQRLWLEADGGYGHREKPGDDAPLRLFVSGALDFDPAAASLSDDHSNTRVTLEEAYLTIDRVGFDVVIGRKLHRIGTGDGVNPMDLINPLDYRDPVASGRADSREPVPLVMATVEFSGGVS